MVVDGIVRLVLLGAITALCLGRLSGGVKTLPDKEKTNTAVSAPSDNVTKKNNTFSSAPNNATNTTNDGDDEGTELTAENDLKEKYGVLSATKTMGDVTEVGQDQPTTKTPKIEAITQESMRREPLLTLQELEAIPGRWACDSPIYCRGPLLDAVQRSRIFPDSKTFVDMPLKNDPEVTLAAYASLVKEHGPLSEADLRIFIDKNFHSPGEELEPWGLPDWVDSPALLDQISDEKLRHFAHRLHRLWAVLGRHIKDSVSVGTHHHSLIHVPNGFVIPGGRFREFYYWDTYWIVKGLLASGMPNTTRGIIENLLHMVKEYGFVPNGGRIYFTNRSQPPLLASMVNAYYMITNDTDFVTKNLPLLEQEYEFWVSNRSVTVTKDGKDYTFARYSVNMSHPRPEGYLEDLEAVHGMTPEHAATQFSHLTSGAESGWDYSTRWFAWHGDDEFTLQSVKVVDIVPVDLNTFLYLTEDIISKFASIAGDSDKGKRYTDLAAMRKAAIDAVMWHEEDGTWYDYDLSTNTTRQRFFLSNITPLLAHPDSDRVEKVINYLQNEQVLEYPGGIPTSTMASGQQWDFPNTWAPLVDILITGLEEASSEMAHDLARNISRTWVSTNYAAWAKTGHLYEKYKVRKLGGIGSSGEYKVQLGFGWTNGVILHLLSHYGNDLEGPEVDILSDKDEGGGSGGQDHSSESKASFVFIPVVILVVAVLAFICFMKRSIKHRAKRPSTGHKYSHAPFARFDD